MPNQLIRVFEYNCNSNKMCAYYTTIEGVTNYLIIVGETGEFGCLVTFVFSSICLHVCIRMSCIKRGDST